VSRFPLALFAAVLVGCGGSPSTAPTSSPLPGILSPSLAEVRLKCSDDVFTFGPAGLASNYELGGFDARAIAEQDADFYGYDADRTDACEQATADAAARYDVAARRGWQPYGSEELWLYRWSNYYLCALAVLGEYEGAPHRLIVGATTLRRAARNIAHESDRPELWPPAFDGCLPGLRLGLQLRLTDA
jgi:hypothetical protein